MKTKTNMSDKTWKIYLKTGDCTVRVFKQTFTHWGAEVRINALTALYPDWIGRFLIKH